MEVSELLFRNCTAHSPGMSVHFSCDIGDTCFLSIHLYLFIQSTQSLSLLLRGEAPLPEVPRMISVCLI